MTPYWHGPPDLSLIAISEQFLSGFWPAASPSNKRNGIMPHTNYTIQCWYQNVDNKYGLDQINICHPCPNGNRHHIKSSFTPGMNLIYCLLSFSFLFSFLFFYISSILVNSVTFFFICHSIACSQSWLVCTLVSHQPISSWNIVIHLFPIGLRPSFMVKRWATTY